jgi:hypothetical protein
MWNITLGFPPRKQGLQNATIEEGVFLGLTDSVVYFFAISASVCQLYTY